MKCLCPGGTTLISRWLSDSDTTGQRHGESIDPGGITPRMSRVVRRNIATVPLVARDVRFQRKICGIPPGCEDRWTTTISGGVARYPVVSRVRSTTG